MLNSNNLEDLDSISKRLKYLVDTLGVKQSHLASKLGLSPSGLHYILNSDVKFSKTTKKIAEYLNVNEQWIKTGCGNIYHEDIDIKIYKVPIYNNDQLKLLYTNKSASITPTQFLVTTMPCQNKLFGTYIYESDFSPKFEIGDILIFEQVSEFKDGEIFLVYFSKIKNLSVKYVFNLNQEIILTSDNKKPIKFSESSGDLLVGVYRECIKRNLPT